MLRSGDLGAQLTSACREINFLQKHTKCFSNVFFLKWGLRKVLIIFRYLSPLTVTALPISFSKKYGPMISSAITPHNFLRMQRLFNKLFRLLLRSDTTILFVHISWQMKMGLVAHYSIFKDVSAISYDIQHSVFLQNALRTNMVSYPFTVNLYALVYIGYIIKCYFKIKFRNLINVLTQSFMSYPK